MHREFPSVQRLEVHLPEQQQVMFNEDGSLMGILTDARHTRLTRWFEFNKRKKLSLRHGKMPFTLQRRQFPVRPAFAMTINKF